MRRTERRKPNIVEHVDDQLFDAIFVVDSTQDFHADLWHVLEIGLIYANVAENLDSALPHAHAHIQNAIAEQLKVEIRELGLERDKSTD